MGNGTHRFAAALTTDLVTQQVGDELVVYDGTSKEAHCLNPLATAVFLAADGETSPADLAAIASRALSDTIDVAAIEEALEVLADKGLVSLNDGGISRRRFIQRSAAVGGAVVSGALVTSVVTPAYAGTGSTVTTTGFSGLAVIIEECGTGTFYAVKFNSSAAQDGCGTPGSHPGGTCTWPPAAYSGPDPACPPVTVTATVVTSGGVTSGIKVSVPSNYEVRYWTYFYGNTKACGEVCPTGGQSGAKGPYTIPICG
jgi:hypothetical protein